MIRVTYGDVPVPWTVSWSEEASYWVASDPLLGGALAIQQTDIDHRLPRGVPNFKRPHFNRQREAIMLSRCDLCAGPLKGKSRYALSRDSHSSPLLTSGPSVHLEPLLHAECARICLAHCPALQKQAANGSLRIRRVSQYTKHAIGDMPERIAELVPDYRGSQLVTTTVGLQIHVAHDEPVDAWLKAAASPPSH